MLLTNPQYDVMGYFSWYILINLLGHILRDGVGIMLNKIHNRIPESIITPISICLFVSIMVSWLIIYSIFCMYL